MQKITTFLTFADRAEDAVNFYTSVFPNSRIMKTSRYGDAGPAPKGSFMSATFELEGQEFIALNGGPSFSFAPGISLFVSCETQDEIDELWEKLSDGGEQVACGWLTDRFGVSWQIVPRVLEEMLSDRDPEKANAVMNAMLRMTKLDIDGLRRAYAAAGADEPRRDDLVTLSSHSPSRAWHGKWCGGGGNRRVHCRHG